ncbi:hypothetical protein [Phenylobacterium sp. J367]|uniref:hypothetical protein n=1 Tax=Phenylobacterium sp. J367 TaxID=2898435 RepID=UPI002150D452|nr:hypothetical protein [Phenylobacterium sp. J367]MCR5880663.1 hypothetical protein [Phenylobacterium sp. J367]
MTALVRDGRRSPSVSTFMLAAAAALLALAWGLDVQGWLRTGLRPEDSPQGATVAALVSWQGLFVGVAAVMGLYALARLARGYVRAAQPATFEAIGLFIAYSAGQGAFAAALPRLFPGG